MRIDLINAFDGVRPGGETLVESHRDLVILNDTSTPPPRRRANTVLCTLKDFR